MEDSHDATVYRFKPYFRWVSFLQAAGAVLLGSCMIFLESRDNQHLRGPINQGFAGICLYFLAAYLVAQAVQSNVILGADYVVSRDFWGTRTLTRDEILGVRIVWNSGIPNITLQPKSSNATPISIPRFYAFDEKWARWISSLPDLDRDHRLEVIR